jgi:hypothetical protein
VSSDGAAAELCTVEQRHDKMPELQRCRLTLLLLTKIISSRQLLSL